MVRRKLEFKYVVLYSFFRKSLTRQKNSVKVWHTSPKPICDIGENTLNRSSNGSDRNQCLSVKKRIQTFVRQLFWKILLVLSIFLGQLKLPMYLNQNIYYFILKKNTDLHVNHPEEKRRKSFGKKHWRKRRF